MISEVVKEKKNRKNTAEKCVVFAELVLKEIMKIMAECFVVPEVHTCNPSFS
jgi:hypothetical protein